MKHLTVYLLTAAFAIVSLSTVAYPIMLDFSTDPHIEHWDHPTGGTYYYISFANPMVIPDGGYLSYDFCVTDGATPGNWGHSTQFAMLPNGEITKAECQVLLNYDDGMLYGIRFSTATGDNCGWDSNGGEIGAEYHVKISRHGNMAFYQRWEGDELVASCELPAKWDPFWQFKLCYDYYTGPGGYCLWDSECERVIFRADRGGGYFLQGWFDNLMIIDSEATVDIDPDTLNKKSRGRWVTCYIELPEGYDVRDVDIGSILLNGSVAAESRPVGYGDYDSDGIEDLMVKFDRAQVAEVLPVGSEVEIQITGSVGDGDFLGYDYIRVIEPPDSKDSQEPTIVFESNPNPFTNETEVRLSVPDDRPVNVGIYNVAGQRVRLLTPEITEAGRAVLSWDGTDDHGRRLPAGIYFLRVETHRVASSHKIIMLK